MSNFDFMSKSEQYKKLETEKIKAVKENPLCDYKAQIEDKRRPRTKILRETSLAANLKLNFVGIDDDTEISYRDDIGNFDHSKLLEINAETKHKIFGLAASTHSLLIWILFNIDYRNDTIRIERNLVRKSGLKLAIGTFAKS